MILSELLSTLPVFVLMNAHSPQELNFEVKWSVECEEEYKSERASYAYEYSGFDKDFVLLLNAECGSWNCGLHKKKYLREGEWWSDGFICGISAYYKRREFIEAKKAYHVGDWKKQVEICHDLYLSGTRFYGWDHRKTRGKNIVFNKK